MIRRAAGHRRVPPARDGAAVARSGRPARVAGLRRLRACPRATRRRRCRRAASRWSRSRSRPAPLVRLVREFRPHVMTTYDEDGGYPHPDHIMCHRVSVEAFEAAGDADRYPGYGAPWQPLKLYYDRGFSRAKVMALHEAMLAAGPGVADGGVAGALGGPAGPAGDHPGRVRATTSRSATGRCSRTPPRSTRTAGSSPSRWSCSGGSGRPRTTSWPRSLVPSAAPEDDLFAGVRDRVEVSSMTMLAGRLVDGREQRRRRTR